MNTPKTTRRGAFFCALASLIISLAPRAKAAPPQKWHWRKLQGGEILKEGDLYDAANGDPNEVSALLAGLPVSSGGPFLCLSAYAVTSIGEAVQKKLHPNALGNYWRRELV